MVKVSTVVIALLGLLLFMIVVAYGSSLGENSVLKVKLEELKANYTSLKAERDMLKDERDMLVKRVSYLDDEYSKLRAKYSSLEGEYRSVSNNYFNLKLEFDSLKLQFDRLNNEYTRTKTEYESLMTEIERGVAIANSATWLSEDRRLRVETSLSPVLFFGEVVYYKLNVTVTNVGELPLKRVWVLVIPYCGNVICEDFYLFGYYYRIDNVYIGETFSHLFTIPAESTSYKVYAFS